NANVFEVALDQLHVVNKVTPEASRGCKRCFEAVRMPSLRQQAPGLSGIILIVLCPRTELVNGQRPLDEATGNCWSWFTSPPHRLNELLAVDRVGDGTSHAHIVEGYLIGAHVDHARHIGQIILVHQVWLALLECLQVLLTHTPPVPWSAVNLPGAVHGQARRLILEDQPLYPIDIRLILAEVGRIALKDRLHVGLVALEEEGA